ncbi:MAG TPA: TetR/AcrR family transcriptional regulator [Vicinamibacterales bacterium]|nr:TetR/AcrR family transcriptional regulator [Vicinamibacterales bacterium]
MPWPEDHKARTRERIVEAAAAAFRAGGVAGVRVEDVMARAGLTHGGFYAHFDSKEALLRDALARAGDQTVEMLSKPATARAAGDRLQAVVDTYLSQAHAAHPERGCPLAALGPEIARADGPAREALAAAVTDRLAWMRGLVPPGRGTASSDTQIIGTLACMVGGIILARAAGGNRGVAILKACREFVRQCSGGAATRAARVRKRPSRG